MGAASRKYKLALLSILLIILVGLLTVNLPAFVPALDTVVGGIIAIFGIYGGVNLGQKWVTGKQQPTYPDEVGSDTLTEDDRTKGD